MEDACKFLKGQADVVQERLKSLMMTASEEMRFEEAASYRDRLQSLATILRKQTTISSDIKTADFIALSRSGDKCCVQIFSYVDGRHVGHVNLFPKAFEDEKSAEILRIVLMTHYLDRDTTPPEFLISEEIEEKEGIKLLFSEKLGRKVEIAVPKRGVKAEIIGRVLQNANDALKRKQAQGASWRKQLSYFSELLEHVHPIKRIETYDISNIQGRHPVASMVVAGEEGMLKKDYRKFAIKSLDRPDDYRMMREVLMRRYSRLLKETDKARSTHDELPVWPDVVMVDGGKGHLRVLTDVMAELGIDGPQAPILCAIAKGEERDKGLETIYQQNRMTPLDIEFNSPLKFMLQIIRDESHRFAIGYHRAKRSKETIRSVLDDIPSVGPKRKKALLLTFGSAKGVKDASVADLLQVEGVSKELAQHIYDYLH